MKLLSRDQKELTMLRFRKQFRFIDKAYNHFNRINVSYTFHNQKTKNELSEQAKISLRALLEPTSSDNKTSRFNKTIWMYWDKGLENAPEVVKLSVHSWKKMNPDYDVKFLCDSNLQQELGFDFQACFHIASVRCIPAIKADLLRLHLISRFGGVWADVTTFCLQPLSLWLPQELKHYGTFTFRHKTDVSCPIEVWLIASNNKTPIVKNVLHRLSELIFKERQQSLYVSGTSLTEKNLPLSTNIALTAEKEGFLPYFSTGYAFFEVLSKVLRPDGLKDFISMTDGVLTNNYAGKRDSFEVFRSAVVSKQTYTKRYMKSELYQRRRAFLINKLDAMTH